MASTDEEAANLAKYRATEQFKTAWKIISPKAECAAKCEVQLARILRHIRSWAERDKSNLGEAEERKLLEKLAKTLRTAIDITNQLRYGHWLGENPWVTVTELRVKEIERRADRIRARARKGGPRKKEARKLAVQWAHRLLEEYGNRPPKRDRLGKWHELARVLFGNEEADLFDYIEDHHRALLAYQRRLKEGRIKPKPVLWYRRTKEGRFRPVTLVRRNKKGRFEPVVRERRVTDRD